jgi:hypothetical protein
MTTELPIALIERWPGSEYKQQHDSMAAALKHNISDAASLLKDIEILNEIELTWESPDVASKQGKYNLKRMGNDALHKRVIQYIIDKKERYERLTKFSDYPAMIMAAYPDCKFIPYEDFNTVKEQTQGSILVRGIAAGKIIDWMRSQHRDYYFIETGYLGNYPSLNNRTGRKIYHRIVKNAMQHNRVMVVPDDRWMKLVAWNESLRYQGWKRSGSKILLVTPSDKPCRYYGIDRQQWVDDTIRKIKLHTDRPIIVREKARRAERTNDTIYHAFDQDIFCTVTYNSIAAVESVAYGIPAIALAPTAAEPVCGNDLSSIEHPPRPAAEFVQMWLNHIAYCQYSIDEMISGLAWQLVKENEQRQTLSN